MSDGEDPHAPSYWGLWLLALFLVAGVAGQAFAECGGP